MFNKKINMYAFLILLMGLMLTATAYAQVEEMHNDTLTAAITGIVVDSETQQPVAGIELKIKATERAHDTEQANETDQTYETDQGYESNQTTETDEEGKFSFMGLNPGMYTIVATPEGYQEVSKEVELTSSGKELTIQLKTRTSL